MSANGHDFSRRGAPRTTQRRSGIYGKHGNNRVLIASEGECTTPVEIKRETIRSIAIEAAFRRVSAQKLIGDVLDVVAGDDLFAAVLGTGEKTQPQKAR